MSADEVYADRLRARVDQVVPTVAVDVDRVVPRARRRRAVLRGGAAALTVAVLVGAGWGAGAVLGAVPGPGLAPAGPSGSPTAGEPVPSVPAQVPSEPAAAGPVVPAVADVAEDGTVTGVVGDPWSGDEPYWYVLSVGVDGTERRETWSSRERPGLGLTDGDAASAFAFGAPVVLGSFVLDGQRFEMLTDPTVLPTDGAALEAVLRASLQPDRGAGSDDDKVVEAVRSALSWEGLMAPALRDAYWAAAALVPGARVVAGEDAQGRPGEVLTYTASTGEEVVLVRDLSTGLLLQQGGTLILEQRVAGDPPVEPTLDVAGCVAWATC